MLLNYAETRSATSQDPEEQANSWLPVVESTSSYSGNDCQGMLVGIAATAAL
jgi:hypothetical protein